MSQIDEEMVDGRERLLRAARQLFLDRGYASVSMQEIAAAAAMTRAAPYYHFRDKEDLFVQVFTGEMHRIHETLAARLVTAETFREQLLTVVAFVTESGRSSFGRLVTEFDRHVSPERRQQLKRDNPPPINEIRALFARAEVDGALRKLDARSAYAVFIRLIVGQMELVRTEPEMQELVGWDALESPEILVDAFLNGV